MKNFRNTMILINFLTNFFIRLGIFLWIGVILCLLGSKFRMCLAIGVALIAFDFIVSIIESIKIYSSVKNSQKPIMKDLNRVLDGDTADAHDAIGSLLDKYGLPGGNGNGNMNQTNEERFLRANLDNDSTAEECLRVFKEMCEMPIDDDLLLFECCGEIFSNDRFIFSLVRQYPNGEGEYYQLHVTMEFELDKENRRIVETVWSDSVPDFWKYIENSKAYKYACTHKAMRVVVNLDET